jgi:TRAP transporter TAXI family solute receptor
MFLVLTVSVVVWYVTRDTLPEEIRIATATQHSLYREFADNLEERLEQQTGREVLLEDSSGSVQNRTLLGRRKVELALLQSDAISMVQKGSASTEGLAVVAPLYPEVVHVIARRDSGIQSVTDLRGRKVYLGPHASGMRRTAESILAHFHVATDPLGRDCDSPLGHEQDFERWLQDDAADAAIVTTGMQNSALKRVLATDSYQLIPIPEAKALASQSAHLREFTIPRGYYSGDPTVPARPVATVATTALLVVRDDVSEELVRRTLRALYEGTLQLDYPILIPRENALDWAPVPQHPVSRRYFDPQDRIGWLASVMESIAATKELLFALGAGLYLLWDRWRRLKEREERESVRRQKEHLDTFLQRTLRIEAEQMDTKEPEKLQGFLDQITKITLQALTELTHEDLRGDRTFSIFLMQCANLISKIQLKIVTYGTRERGNSNFGVFARCGRVSRP